MEALEGALALIQGFWWALALIVFFWMLLTWANQPTPARAEQLVALVVASTSSLFRQG
jgi:hypothetical protein